MNADQEQNPIEDSNVDLQGDADSVIRQKLLDSQIPGFQAEFDPDEAERAGAFVEDALSVEDALESAIDIEPD